MKVAVVFLGCKVNQAECEEWRQALASRHFELVKDTKKAELVVVNTCVVTKKAELESIKLIKAIVKGVNKPRVVVTGCLTGLKEKDLFGAEIISKKSAVLDFISGFGACEAPAVEKMEPTRTRALVKIEDGCNNACAFCVVWRVRGSIVSTKVEDVAKKVVDLERSGVKDVVLVGVNIGKYNSNGVNLPGLVQLLLAETKKVRIRLSSINPMDFSEELLLLFANPRVCAHLHVSLQSGSTKILKLMNRKYSVDDFLQWIKRLKKIRKEIAITGDIIVGFSGETEKEFLESCSVVNKVGFAELHVFPYSYREGNSVDVHKMLSAEELKKRAAKMGALAKKLEGEYKKSFLGKSVEVVLEKPSGGYQYGTSSNYLKIKVDKIMPRGTMAKVKIESLNSGVLCGRIIKTL